MQRLNRKVQYEGLIVFDDKGRSWRAGSRSFGRFGFGDTASKYLLQSTPTGIFSVQFTQVTGAPNNSTGAGVAMPGGNQGDPGQTYTDFMKGVSAGIGTAPAWTGADAATLAAIVTYLSQAEADEHAGDTGTPLMAAASEVCAQLNATAAQCVLYQQNDQQLCVGNACRTNQRGDIYSNWLHTLGAQLVQAQATLAQTAATESAQITGQAATQTVGGATYVAPGTTIGANIAPTPGSLATVASSTTTVFGFPLTTVVIGGVVLVGLGYFLLRKKKPAPAAEVA